MPANSFLLPPPPPPLRWSKAKSAQAVRDREDKLAAASELGRGWFVFCGFWYAPPHCCAVSVSASCVCCLWRAGTSGGRGGSDAPVATLGGSAGGCPLRIARERSTLLIDKWD
jgi:hypothetical protein